jgi:hypothetical protein
VGTWLNTIVGVDVACCERQALSAKHTAKIENALPIATIENCSFIGLYQL